MSEINVIIRTADQTRKAELELDTNHTSADVIQASVDKWALPTDTDYSLVNFTSGKTLNPTDSLATSRVKDGEILEIQPILVAG